MSEKNQKRLEKIKKKIEHYFFEYAQDKNIHYPSLLRDAVEEVLIDELNFVEHYDLQFYTEDRDEMKFINEELTFLVERMAGITDVWAIHLTHLCSDGRFHQPASHYYIGEDSEGIVSYVILGDGAPWIDYDVSYSTVFGKLLEDLGPKHPDRAMKAIKEFIENHKDKLEELGEDNIWGLKIDPSENYVILNSYNDQFDIYPMSELREITLHEYNTGRDTLYAHKEQGIFIKIEVSRYQGSADYTASKVEADLKDIALLEHLKEIHKDRLAIINPYPPHRVLKVINSSGDVCTPKKEWRFDPETRKFQGDGDQQCPPPILN
jgi:hypothetical protein